ncbi:hypothetical protein TWF281_006620 [Arthrobotrys megalospora]
MAASILSSTLPKPADNCPVNDYNDGAVETTNILISGTRPIQLGATLKSPTNMSIKGALSLSDEEYEQIRDSIDTAIHNEELLRNLDLDAKNSTEEERTQFHQLVSGYLSSDLSNNSHLVAKLTVRYKDVSPWLLYKFVLLRRKKYKNSGKGSGSREDPADTSHSTIDIGNPNVKDDTASVGSTIRAAHTKELRRHGLTDAEIDRFFEGFLNADYDGSDELSDAQPPAKKVKREDPKIAETKAGKSWGYVSAVSVALVSVLVGVWFYKF